MKALQVIELFAGNGPDGRPVVETVRVRQLEDDQLQLVQSPAFVRGLASGDRIRYDGKSREFELVQRSGNLCVRVFSRRDIEALMELLVPELEKLGAELDLQTPRMLVFSIHVSCGFTAVEQLLNDAIADDPDTTWMYGNVYDPVDGVTPLNWWQSILKPA